MIEREMEELGIPLDKSVEIVAKGVSSALRREPIIILMIVALVLIGAGGLYYSYVTEERRARVLMPILEQCIERPACPACP